MGNLDAARTLVVTTVHDEQVVDDMPAGGLTKHDVPVDVIVTPTRVLRVPAGSRAPKPSGVYWDLLSPQKLAQIKVLRDLKQRLELAAGAPLPSGPAETLPPTASRNGRKSGIRPGGGAAAAGDAGGGKKSKPRRRRPSKKRSPASPQPRDDEGGGAK